MRRPLKLPPTGSSAEREDCFTTPSPFSGAVLNTSDWIQMPRAGTPRWQSKQGRGEGGSGRGGINLGEIPEKTGRAPGESPESGLGRGRKTHTTTIVSFEVSGPGAEEGRARGPRIAHSTPGEGEHPAAWAYLRRRRRAPQVPWPAESMFMRPEQAAPGLARRVHTSQRNCFGPATLRNQRRDGYFRSGAGSLFLPPHQ
ncbi:hypothetical protein P7K49_010125 [Saguinus oedipus]|uniref:Uncharacterized protein n=1 Tax=Saguinus oedipus TaxID=9490 RepID=A0ABQ9VND8_SAGOE|nr:hypothetical protein P7K49_010125 [Saguinus oedipus]